MGKHIKRQFLPPHTEGYEPGPCAEQIHEIYIKYN